VSEGLFHRVCLRTGKEWSEASEQAWMASVYKFYGAGASEELDCVPANGGGAWLSRALIESRMSAGTPVLRLTCPEGYELKPDDVRWSETQDWLDTSETVAGGASLTHVLSWARLWPQR
jgi:phage FluMu gp28-like protein